MVSVVLLYAACLIHAVGGIATHSGEKDAKTVAELKLGPLNSSGEGSGIAGANQAVAAAALAAPSEALPPRALIRKVQSSLATPNAAAAAGTGTAPAAVAAATVQQLLDSGALEAFYANTRGGGEEIDGLELLEAGLGGPPAADTEARSAGKGAYAAVHFESVLRTCDPGGLAFDRSGMPLPSKPPGSRELDDMTAVLAVKKAFEQLGIPLILLNSLVLGWQRNCMAVPDDARVSLGTFGSWVSGVGLPQVAAVLAEHGHRLDTRFCSAGPDRAGCVLRVQVRGVRDRGTLQLVGLPSVDIAVLFPPPCPWKAAAVAARFQLCDHRSCGERCEACGLAYAWHDDGNPESQKFVPCPVPLRHFELVAWMNVTFWAPANAEEYLGAEYGESARARTPPREAARVDEFLREAARQSEAVGSGAWAAHVLTARGACRAYLSKQIYLSMYPAAVLGLPAAREVVAMEAEVQRKQRDRIAFSAEAEASFAGPRLRAAMASEPVPPELAAAVDAVRSAAVPVCCFGLAGCLLSLSLVAAVLIARVLHGRFGKKFSSSSLDLEPPSAASAGEDDDATRWPPLWLQHCVGAASWACSAAALPFLQQKADTAHSSVLSAVLLAWLLRSLFGAVSLRFGGVPASLAQLGPKEEQPSDVVPLLLWTLLPGGCFAVADVLSFLSLQTLDPATYQVALLARLPLWHFRTSLASEPDWPPPKVSLEASRTSWTGCFALLSLAFAVFAKGLDLVMEGTHSLASRRGLVLVGFQLGLQTTGAIATQELRAKGDLLEKHGCQLLELCTDLQGFLLLTAACVVSRCSAGGETLRELLGWSLWEGVLQDPWVAAAVVGLAACGSRACLRRQPSAFELHGGYAAFVSACSAAACMWGPSGGSAHSALVAGQACILASLCTALLEVCKETPCLLPGEEHCEGKDGRAPPLD
eukprot:TRINITY_DN50879_c0_g1_i1.p1 TRINITY_DN50879_c0_g1~~TRINITY_DN50879_c0_g1_i1.p1  ORF type:complete len:929 (+),score=198.74 TRINITY_DN50879_c0_g1_i1:91-2877(+)